MLLTVNYIEPNKYRNGIFILKRIKTKFLHAGYPVRFNEEKEELLIPKLIFDKTKLLLIRLPFAPKIEKFTKHSISKLQTFTNDTIKFHIIWNTRKIQSLFNNKGKVQH